jgi:hypothetical protein
MIWEVVASLVLGAALLALVLLPVIRPPGPRAAVYEPLEPEETVRGVALAALREIEFDRETGKLSDSDYAFLKGRYTAEAIAALRAEGAAGSDDSGVEAMIAARVRTLRGGEGGPPPCVTCGPRPEPDAAFCSECGRRLVPGPGCARCGAALRPDGRFCEACGTSAAA